MKKFVILLCTLSMMLSLTACGGEQGSTNDVSAETKAPAVTEAPNNQASAPAPQSEEDTQQPLVGQVTAIDGANVTVLLGEYSMPDMGDWEMPENGQMPEDMPDFGDGQTPPDIPEGTMPNEERPENAEDGEAPWGDGERPERPDGGGGFGGGRGQMNFFTAGTESATYDLTNAEIMVQEGEGANYGTLEDISVDSLLEITLNDDGTVASVRVMPSDGMGGGEPMGVPGDPDEVSQQETTEIAATEAN